MVRVVVVMVRVAGAGHVFVGDPSVLVVGMGVGVVMGMVVVVGSGGPEALEALELLGHLVGPDEGFHGVLRRQVERLRVHLLVTVGHPVEILQVRFLLGGAEAGRGGHRAARGADRGGGHRASRLETRAVPARAIGSAERLLLHVKFHQVEVVDVLHGQGAGGQLGADAQLGSHRAVQR